MDELMEKNRRNKRKLFIGVAIVIVLLVGGLAIFIRGYQSAKEKYTDEIVKLEGEIDRLSEPIAVYEEASKEIDISIINAEIQDIGELATLEYLYTDAGKFEDAKQIFGKDVPFTKKSFIAKWDGSIKAGVKVDEISAEIDEVSRKILVHIPKAEILSHELDDESFETLDENDGLFNPIEIDNIREFDTSSKGAMETRAIENGILDKALENAKDIIYKLIKSAVAEQDYNIVFEVMD